MGNKNSRYIKQYGKSIRQIATETGLNYYWVYKLLILGYRPKTLGAWEKIQRSIGGNKEYLPEV